MTPQSLYSTNFDCEYLSNGCVFFPKTWAEACSATGLPPGVARGGNGGRKSDHMVAGRGCGRREERERVSWGRRRRKEKKSRKKMKEKNGEPCGSH